MSERQMPIEKFAERIPDPEKGSVIMRLTNVVFAVIARVIDTPIGKHHRAFVFAERVIVLLRLPIVEREIVKAEFDRFLGKENATHIHSFVERAASQIVHLMVVRLFLAELDGRERLQRFLPQQGRDGRSPSPERLRQEQQRGDRMLGVLREELRRSQQLNAELRNRMQLLEQRLKRLESL